ncbi:sensor histidine kinase [Thalassotalea sp. Y01]|uniref:ATP-binding protein n=1 Tax=Thalassotalea sp. Y01 TaxID=2729613 RepID=UPI00145C3EC3|nr:sensor histidine kinase [Thalassotalea sp. Y01]NMP17815.1 sensor histidine kinase [Thalassotalea sp. Y01]
MANASSYFASLSSRILLSAVLLVLVMVPSLALLLNSVVEQQLQQASDDEMVALNYGILAVAEVDNQQLFMPDQLPDPNFNLADSGQYAVISQGQNILWQSQSMLAGDMPSALPTPPLGNSEFSQLMFKDSNYRSHSFTVSFVSDEQEFQLTVHIFKDLTPLQQRLAVFQQKLFLWGTVTLAVLLLLQFVYLKWTLSPVRRLRREVIKVEKGEQNQLNGDYPTELQQVAEQLNGLIKSLHHQQKRFANALSDLAHSLKTPLAVLATNDKLDASVNRQLSSMADIIEHQLKRAQSSGQIGWHVSVNISETVEKLVRTMNKIYADKELQIEQHLDSNASFKGDQRDLMEMLGNLLDNACKAANKNVRISLSQGSGTIIAFEDDGVGIAPEQQQAILKRGVRADSYDSGHGIGLAIVRDLIDSYGGTLHISDSEQLAGAKFEIHLP